MYIPNSLTIPSSHSSPHSPNAFRHIVHRPFLKTSWWYDYVPKNWIKVGYTVKIIHHWL